MIPHVCFLWLEVNKRLTQVCCFGPFTQLLHRDPESEPRPATAEGKLLPGANLQQALLLMADSVKTQGRKSKQTCKQD